MELLTNNFISEMRGPYFLLFFIFVMLGVALIVYLIIKKVIDNTNLLPPYMPNNIDPYFLSYLRGGELALLKTAFFSLREQKKITDEHEIIAENKTDLPNPIEQAVYNCIEKEHKIYEIYNDSEFKACVKNYEDKVIAENLCLTNYHKTMSVLAIVIGLVLVEGLGIYKIIIAISKGIHNYVVLLVLLSLLLVVVLVALMMFIKGAWLSRRGKEFLTSNEFRYANLKHKIRMNKEEPIHASNPDYLMAMSVFGIAALAGTSYHDYYANNPLNKLNSSSSSSSSSGCSSSGCSSSGCSSSGCSSSCGGGCGGCGGGGD